MILPFLVAIDRDPADLGHLPGRRRAARTSEEACTSASAAKARPPTGSIPRRSPSCAACRRSAALRNPGAPARSWADWHASITQVWPQLLAGEIRLRHRSEWPSLGFSIMYRGHRLVRCSAARVAVVFAAIPLLVLNNALQSPAARISSTSFPKRWTSSPEFCGPATA